MVETLKEFRKEIAELLSSVDMQKELEAKGMRQEVAERIVNAKAMLSRTGKVS